MRRAILDSIVSGLAAALATAAARGVAKSATQFADSHSDSSPLAPSAEASLSTATLAKDLAAGLATAAVSGALRHGAGIGAVKQIALRAGAIRIHPAVSTAYVVIGLGWTVYTLVKKTKQRKGVTFEHEKIDSSRATPPSNVDPVKFH
ncbi:MAG TPA: hypothetical protein VK629_16755 [Steroidobacteraceae bacterium]|nr:hypothetical protein [Steroidobacteraceae bacterium]